MFVNGHWGRKVLYSATMSFVTVSLEKRFVFLGPIDSVWLVFF